MKFILTFTLIFLWMGKPQAMSQTFYFDYTRDFDSLRTRTQDPKDALYYPSQLERFQGLDTTITDFEVICLLIGFTADPEFHPYKDLIMGAWLNRLNEGGQYAEVLEKGLKILQTHPLDVSVLREVSFAYRKLGEVDKADEYAFMAAKILSAMASSGSGRNAEDAIFALNPYDGRVFIIHYLHGEVGEEQYVKDRNQNFIDKLEYLPRAPALEDSGKVYFILEHCQVDLRMIPKDDN